MANRFDDTINNNLHICSGKKEPLVLSAGSMSEINLTNEELIGIFDFYLLHAPIKKDKDEKWNNYRWLGEYGWRGSSDLSQLERLLLKNSGMNRFVIVKADTISETIKNMDLEENICVEHPRAVLKMPYQISVNEDGQIVITPKEKRMVCLFRHIRNAIAHNRSCLLNNGEMLLLEDWENDKKTTKNILSARILIRPQTLIDWIRIIDKNHIHYYKSEKIMDITQAS